jgi:hypothetical protein
VTLIGTQDWISRHGSAISSAVVMILVAFGFVCRPGKLWHLLYPSEKTDIPRKCRPSQNARRSRLLPFFLMIPVSLGSGGCLRMGPKMVAHDRFDFSSVIERSWKEQMLLNMVRLRYLDPPFFLDVQQVIAQYTLEGSGTIAATDLSGTPSASVGVSGRWAESPTVTYNPMSGEKFTKSLLQPISPIDIWELVEAGWPISDIFKVTVRSINGLHATTTTNALKHPGDPDFYRVIVLLQALQSADAFGLDVEDRGGKGTGVVTFFRSATADKTSIEAARTARELLRLSPDAKEFRISFGALPQDDKEIAMLTRSMLEILMEATAGVEVPDSDIKEGRASKIDDQAPPAEIKGTFKVRVRSSSGKPPASEAFAAVRYRNQWFWIDDRDLDAKRGLSFLMMLFTLVESGATAAPPVLTISKP